MPLKRPSQGAANLPHPPPPTFLQQAQMSFSKDCDLTCHPP